MIEANNDEVICPNCVTQFRAIPVNVHEELAALRKANLDCVDHFNAISADYERLRKVAQTVVDRWDTPLWKDVPATAEYIGALRKELGQ